MARLIAMAFLALVLGSGCFVFEELDAAHDTLDSITHDDPSETPEPGFAPTPDSEPLPGTQELAKWWQKAKSMIPGERDPSIVRCETRDGVQFMRAKDCEMRGGRTGS